MSDWAVRVENMSKKFRLYQERNQTLKSAILRGKTSTHQDFWALENITFDVIEGQTHGLIGTNGSGKSTLLKCLAKIYWPTSGTISYRGRIASLLEVGSGFHEELSGRENIYLNGSILGMTKKEIDKKFDEIVDFSGVEHYLDQPIKNYSSGMYVRLGFSIAINVDPDILVVDEVLSVGDEGFQRKSYERFLDFKKRGKTIILVTHTMPVVEEICDSVTWLDRGTMMQTGPATEVVAAYRKSLN